MNTNLTIYIAAGALILSLMTTIIGAWNAFQNKNIALLVAELRLNIMKDMNGKYERVEDARDLKSRIERLEAAKMRLNVNS